jgi:hypothetical protein
MAPLTLDFTTDSAPSRMGGATGAASGARVDPSPRPSLLDRLIEERRGGECADPPRRTPRESALSGPSPAAHAPSTIEASPAAPVTAGERSLDDLVTATWSSLATAEPASCFVCGGDLLPRFGAGARPVGARCTDCGSELS